MTRLTVLASALLAGLWVSAPVCSSAVGVTLITHGLNGNTDGWVTGMADALARYSDRTTNAPIFKFYLQQSGSSWDILSTNLSGGNALTVPGGEIIVMFDWRQWADGNSSNTYQVAAMLAPKLTLTNFVPELGGHALAEFPMHLIGHSRGGSLVCELSRLLGTNGIWVDHVTTLDAHPLNNDGFNLDRLLYSAVDAPARIYQNVLFGDSYYQNQSFLVYGEAVPGAYWRRQTNLSGGYSDPTTGAHSDIHLWYHGTIDWSTPTTDSEAWITSAERTNWWASSELAGTNAGLIYSLVGGGDRLSTADPNGTDSARIRDGFNQSWDFGAGVAANRTLLTTNSGDWPNPILANLTTTNIVTVGDTSSVYVYYQYAKPTTSTQAVALYLDDDLNPLNGNERLLEQGTASGTTASQVGAGSISIQWNATNAPVGTHALFVKFSAGGHTRYLYAPEFITIVASPQPTVDIRQEAPGSVVIGVNGRVGQTIMLQRSTDLATWLPIATNTFTAERWELTRSTGQTMSGEFIRACVPQP